MDEKACCERWEDGWCDFGCPCADCKTIPMTAEQVREFYRSLAGDEEE